MTFGSVNSGLANLEKSLNFLQLLNVVAWKGFLIPFGRPRQNMNHTSENLKVIYTAHLELYLDSSFRLNVLCNN